MSKTTDKLKSFVAAHPTLCEIIRFLIVGGLATLADMFVMGLILYAFDPALYPKFYNVWIGGSDPSTAATVVGTCCGFIVGLVINYVLSIIFVFNNKGKSKTVMGFAVFAGLSAIGLAIHTVGMYIGYTLLGINEWIVKIVLTIIVLIYNYISKRLILFIPARKKSEVAATEQPELTDETNEPIETTADKGEQI